MAGVFTIAPVLVLALVNTAAPNTWTRLARLSEVSGDVLFGAVALFAAALAYAGGRTWLRVLAAVVAALPLGRCVAGPLGSTAFDLVAPIGFLVLILAISVSMLAGRWTTTSR